MTVQVTTPKLPAQMPENSAREPKAFAEEKISAQFDISAAKDKENEHYNELRIVYGLSPKRHIGFFFNFIFN